MIPALVKPYAAMVAPWWPLAWRAAVAAALVWVGWHYGGKEAERDLEAARLEWATAHLESIEALRAEQDEQREKSRAVEEQYEQSKTELDDIRRNLPARVVRLCRTAADRGDVPAVPAGSGVHDGAAASDADVPGAAGPDIGGRLYGLADECDDTARRLKALQEWVRSMRRD